MCMKEAVPRLRADMHAPASPFAQHPHARGALPAGAPRNAAQGFLDFLDGAAGAGFLADFQTVHLARGTLVCGADRRLLLALMARRFGTEAQAEDTTATTTEERLAGQLGAAWAAPAGRLPAEPEAPRR